MQITIRSYTPAQQRQAAERVRDMVVGDMAVVDVEYHDRLPGMGEIRSYSTYTEAPENTLRILAVCFGRLGMATTMERDDVEGETLHVSWDQAAWQAAWR